MWNYNEKSVGCYFSYEWIDVVVVERETCSMVNILHKVRESNDLKLKNSEKVRIVGFDFQ